MEVAGFKVLRYFTMDSNILVAIGSLIMIPYNILAIKDKEKEIPFWLDIFKYVGTVSVMVTFLTVVFFLGPTIGYGSMYVGASLYLHGTTPILALIVYSLFEYKDRKFIYTLYSILPVLIYGFIYLLNVVALGNWEDFYGFNVGGFWYISYIVMIIASYGIGIGIHYLSKVLSKKINKA
ncbi:MAG: hypothetical protein K6G38_05525 [Gammaproteobacteria bacterium]|nr:hypothetical protein [Gammaproteobacteria bacterium]